MSPGCCYSRGRLWLCCACSQGLYIGTAASWLVRAVAALLHHAAPRMTAHPTRNAAGDKEHHTPVLHWAQLVHCCTVAAAAGGFDALRPRGAARSSTCAFARFRSLAAAGHAERLRPLLHFLAPWGSPRKMLAWLALAALVTAALQWGRCGLCPWQRSRPSLAHAARTTATCIRSCWPTTGTSLSTLRGICCKAALGRGTPCCRCTWQLRGWSSTGCVSGSAAAHPLLRSPDWRARARALRGAAV